MSISCVLVRSRRPPMKFLAFYLCFAGATVLAVDSAAFRQQVISETACDIDRDGTPERIQIVLTSGRRYVDAEGWCGQGEKWDGQFVVRVLRGKRMLRETPLKRLFYPEEKEPMPMFFWTPKFKLVMHDYNHDGRMDFNLGQYGSCVGNDYKLFSISRRGTVSVLPLDRKDSQDGSWFVTPRAHENSTSAIKRRGKLTVFSYYNRGEERFGTVVEKWKWAHGRFVRVSSE
jgi:hypothetical protein